MTQVAPANLYPDIVEGLNPTKLIFLINLLGSPQFANSIADSDVWNFMLDPAGWFDRRHCLFGYKAPILSTLSLVPTPHSLASLFRSKRGQALELLH